ILTLTARLRLGCQYGFWVKVWAHFFPTNTFPNHNLHICTSTHLHIYSRIFVFMKIALAQLNYHIGNFSANTEKIKSNILRAKKEGADLVVFAELSVCGYPPRDFLEFSDFIRRCEDAVQEIASVCVGISAIVG